MAILNWVNFRKSSRGGVIFNPKTYVADFGNFKQGFLIMKLVQHTNIRVQGMFFNKCIEKNQNKTHLEEGMCLHSAFHTIQPSYLLAYICNHICNKKLQYNFPKIRGWGASKALWNLSQKFIRFGSRTLPLVQFEEGYVKRKLGFASVGTLTGTVTFGIKRRRCFQVLDCEKASLKIYIPSNTSLQESTTIMRFVKGR